MTVKLAKAAAIRPQIGGAAFQRIAHDREVLSALFAALEAERMIAGNTRLTLVPTGGEPLTVVTAAEDRPPPPALPA